MTLRPFGASSDHDYSLGPHYLADDFEDQKIHAPRDNPSDHNFVMPEHTAGEALRGYNRPDWITVAGDVYAVARTDSGRIGFEPNPGPHIAAVPSRATVAEWQFSAQYGRSDSGEQLFIDLIWDPVRETGWRLRLLDTLKFVWEKHTPNGTTQMATGDWKASWDYEGKFEDFHVSRNYDGEWALSHEWGGKIEAAFQDPWLPQNPRQLRLGSSAYDGGTIQQMKQSSDIYINDPLNDRYRHPDVSLGV